MKILYLTLKKPWFDMILSGEKKEEYREIKPYWFNRFVWLSRPMDISSICERFKTECANAVLESILEYSSFHFKHFDAVEFRNGYAKNAPIMLVKLDKYGIARGRSEWGAPDCPSFVLKLGEIIETRN